MENATGDLTATDLEDGDTLYDNNLDREITIIKPGPNFAPAVAPTGNAGGPIKTKKRAPGLDEVQSRLDTGRYEPLDCAAHRTLDTDALAANPDEDIYIRFGDIPEDERSHNHTDDRDEAGVSVYPATIEAIPADADTDAPGMYVPHGPKLQQIAMLAHRDTYLVTGEEVGHGVDGEPLLQNVETVAELTTETGLGGWVEAGH